jgi:hypothetical protein
MFRYVVGGLAAGLAAAGLLTSAPPASAGCQYGGPPVISKCDGPVQPDGTWQRCVASPQLVYSGASSFLVPERHCDVMSLDQRPGDVGFADPPTHIDG